MKIVLVNMPWQALDYPSLACGILISLLQEKRSVHQMSEYYGNIRWAEFLLEVSGGGLTSDDYTQISDTTFFYGAGDWIFSSALRPESVDDAYKYLEYLREQQIDPVNIARIERMYGYAPDFIEQAAQEILASKPDVVGFSSTFMQNAPSLATARRIKELSPQTVIIFGGGNCDGELGAALHRNFPFVDFVVRGEGERVFVELVDALERGSGYELIQGLCWRNEDGRSIPNFPQKETLDLATVPEPNYDAYFNQLEESGLIGYVEPKLTYESARGCWWGEKHQCLFCGLNGSHINFRSKEPIKMWETILNGIKKYQTLDVIMVDNIIDMKYFKSFLPLVADSGLDVRVHYEIKSNLRDEHVKLLRAANVFHVQPGIESLNSRCLEIMSKGVSGTQNVKLLQRCEENDLEVAWNYLYGFPGEQEEDYTLVIDQFPALYHLHPPAGGSRIALERFSPYFENSELGLERIGPKKFYEYVYDLPVEELTGLAFLFESTKAGIQGELVNRLHDELRKWQDAYGESTLHFSQHDDGSLLLVDRRVGWEAREWLLEQPLQVQAYLQLMEGLTLETLRVRLAGKFPELDVSHEQLSEWVQEWKKSGLVFEEADRFLALAIKEDPQRIRMAR